MIDDHTFDEVYAEFVADEPSANGHNELISLDALLDTDEEPYDWLVPGLVERGDRIILTGLEGGGKSTLTRQFGAQVAQGVHPFGGDPFEPIQVLNVDCENSRRQVRRKADVLRKGPGARLEFVFRPDGVDLTITQHVAWLEAKVKLVEPQLLIIGPVYKMAGGDPKDEQNAKSVATTLDHLRVTHNFAVLLEAHSPYADGSKSKRPERPYGASLWSRWPEFGLHLAADGTLRHWRGQRDERQWPAKLRRGDEWPWEVEIGADAASSEWAGPTKCMAAVLDFFRGTGQTEYSGNQLHDSMRATGTPYHRTTIGQAAERLVLNGRLAVRVGTRNSRLYSHQDNPSQQPISHGEASNDDIF